MHQVPDRCLVRADTVPGWDVRTLVNHVVGEELWTVPLLEGRTIAEVGDRFDGDVLGAVPSDVVDSAAKAAAAAFEEPGAADRTVTCPSVTLPPRNTACS